MFSGSIVALVTPLLADGAVDYVALNELVEFHIEQGTDAIVAVGTTGESATLNPDEHIQVVAAVVKAVAGRIPVIGGAGANATAEAIELTRRCEAVGVDATLSVTPYYNKPTQAGLIAHYSAIEAIATKPIILYNVPGRTCCDLLPETTAVLAKLPGIIAIKDATGDLSRVPVLQQLCPDDFLLFSGDDPTSMEFIGLGGHGVISVTNNVAPACFKAMCDAAARGDMAAAKASNDKLIGLYSALFAEANPIPVKWALAEMGKMPLATLRLPLTELSEAHYDTVRHALVQAGVL
ncbi:4-hydroxy-tetrahydrodipicolinate synthase [Ferrimonas sp. SCSIO 43195]|uniref:4-hydroxy-tetrahydrodipicolinate synthase n=1 Tax=Ferrimonas sp. SCSIO 43195 TaxID=2822844 RepID=UPI0020755157|nr:4-hydroxy-tetrahydrodipicolinate synthase [Ferrimonas sp. SCSIO 43195]USD36377.1 4-hydroxy-tetrahydrodipicolinate synthase [Ferrimonas sp. SCSIO 43195]